MIDAADLKNQYNADGVRQLAASEGLEVKGGRIQCPVCRKMDATRGSATVSTKAGGAGVWNCKSLSCNASGSVIDLLMATRTCDVKEAIRILSDKGAPPPPPPKRERPPIDGAKIWAMLAATDGPGVAYLEGRGLGEAVEREFVRFSVGASGDRWIDKLAAQGYRVAVPLRDGTGAVVRFQLRAIRPPANPKQLKMNLPGKMPADVVFGMPLESRTAPVVYVAEGMADTLAVQLADVVVMGSPGVGLLRSALAHLGDIRGRVVVACPQNDKDGLSQRSFEAFLKSVVAAGGLPRILNTPPDFKDPAEWREKVGPEAFREEVRKATISTAPPLNLIILKGGGEGSQQEGPSDWRPLTDYGNAERLADRHGEDLHYSPASDRWFGWNGVYWVPEIAGRHGGLQIMKRAKDTVRAMVVEAEAIANDSVADAVGKHQNKSESLKSLKAMIELAKSEGDIPIADTDFDKNPWLFNCANGTLNLEPYGLGEFDDEHRREQMLSRISPVVYNPTAACPAWLAFLNQIFGNDEDLVLYMQRFVGYCLTGLNREHLMHVFYGKGRNGKGTFRTAIAEMMGSYAYETSMNTFIASDFNDPAKPRPDLMALMGPRFIGASEIRVGQRLEESLIKRLTGADPITARGLYSGEVKFQPVAKYALLVNDKPMIRHLDDGIRARMRLVPFKQRYWTEGDKEKGPPELKTDKTLIDRLRLEMSGILNWALVGLAAYKELGSLKPPATVIEATEQYLEEMDVIGLFLADKTAVVLGSEFQCGATAAFQRFQSWCEEQGRMTRINQTVFGTYLEDHGFIGGNNGSNRTRKGIGLVSTSNVKDFFADR